MRKSTDDAAAWPPIADAHLDLLSELWHRRAEDAPFHTHWLPKLQAGRVRLQVCPTFAAESELLPELALRRTLAQIGAFHRALHETKGETRAVRFAEDINRIEADETIGLLLALEGVEALGYDVDLIDVFWELGVRMVGLTWNYRNPFADGAGEQPDGGLSRLGRQLLNRLQQLGMLLDLAHASQETFYRSLDYFSGPTLVSHAACRGVHPHPRNLSDEQLHALADHGGLLCIMQLAFTIGPRQPTIERVVDHIEHAVNIVGTDHVGLGGDFMYQLMLATGHQPPPGLGLPSSPHEAIIENLAGPEQYGNLAYALKRRGFNDNELNAILGGNLRKLVSMLPAETPRQ